MRIPRRVPWSTLAELEQVCNWIYTDERDVEAKLCAINRLSAWRAITPLPHALESTLSLLVANIADQRYSTKDDPVSSSTLSLRQNYATALVRLVNGLVDPLQQGAYARSIASIALQIGLPQWLVELRHAATHEELPSLELLRSGAGEVRHLFLSIARCVQATPHYGGWEWRRLLGSVRVPHSYDFLAWKTVFTRPGSFARLDESYNFGWALAWLLQNYFLPTLAGPSNVDDVSGTYNVAPLTHLLKRYKTLMKAFARDGTLFKQHKFEVSQIFQTIENWISEARVASSAAFFRGWGAETSSSKGSGASRADWRERWAVEKFCDALLERGGLVPVSTRKRVTSLKSASLPTELIDLWKNLLKNVHTNHPSFPSILLGRILDALLQRTDIKSDRSVAVDRSRDVCLAGWARWIVDEWGEEQDVRAITPEMVTDDVLDTSISYSLRRRDVVASLVTALGGSDGGDQCAGATLLLQSLSSGYPDLEDLCTLLQPLSQARRSQQTISDAIEEGLLKTMEERLYKILSITRDDTPQDVPVSEGADFTEANIGVPLPPGWSRLPARDLGPCPIGTFIVR